MRLKNKVAVITGSAHGIGKAAALLFAQEGANIVVNYQSDRTAAQEVVSSVRKLGRDAIAMQADVSDPLQVRKLFKEAVEKFKTVDILINNAGLAKEKSFFDITRDDLIAAFDLNLFSKIYCAQEAAKIMQKKGSGKIINTVSICGIGRTSCTSVLPYSTAKGAAITFTKALAKILAPDITVNAVAPGFTQTRYWEGTTKEEEEKLLDSTMTKKWVKPEEIADAFLYLATADNVTGEVLMVDGGYQLK